MRVTCVISVSPLPTQCLTPSGHSVNIAFVASLPDLKKKKKMLS